MSNYYKRYLMVSIPYTLVLFICWNYVPITIDIPIILSMVAAMPLIMKRFLMANLPDLKGKWICTICGNRTNRSPCPRCHTSQFKRA